MSTGQSMPTHTHTHTSLFITWSLAAVDTAGSCAVLVLDNELEYKKKTEPKS